MDKKQEPSLSFNEEPIITTEDTDDVDKKSESKSVKENINLEKDKEIPKKKKKNWFKKKIEKIDKYLYDLEVIFSTKSEIKPERKARNIYILKSSVIFSFYFIFSYASFSGYYYVVSHIEQTQYERSQELENSGGIPIIFSNEEIKSQN